MISDKILHFYKALHPPEDLPSSVEILNPYINPSGWDLTTEFYKKYFSDTHKRKILFGINPGRFGGGVTGIPFTDPVVLQNECGIENDLQKRSELSATFIYEMISSLGGSKQFYSQFFISAISPLGYVQDGKNLNYYDIPNFRKLFKSYAANAIREQLDFPIDTSVAYSIGQGANMKFLKELNNEYQFFDKVIPLPHPRWVMQYRLKRKQEFIDVYKKSLLYI